MLSFKYEPFHLSRYQKQHLSAPPLSPDPTEMSNGIIVVFA